MERSAKLATPRTAATARDPRSVPRPGLAPSVTVMSPWKLLSTVPALSTALTRTAGDSGAPAVALGGAANSRCVAAGSTTPPSWNSLSTWQLTSQASATRAAPRRSRRGLRSDDTEGTAGRVGQPRYTGLERVIHTGLIDAQVREGRDSVHQVHAGGAAELGVLGHAAVVLDHHRHLAGEARDPIA